MGTGKLDMAGYFVLAGNVEFIPVDSITEKTKTGFDYESGDIVITQLNTRATSKVISKDLAVLLQQFRSPKLMAEVIYSFSATQQRDSLEVADEVFGSLVNMYQSGFILPYDSHHGLQKQDLLKLRERFRDYSIIQKYQHLEDSEVYRVKDIAGNMRALKLIKVGNGGHSQALFNNEMAMLEMLDGTVNPKLLEHGIEGDMMFLVTAWCDGITCDSEAAKYRNINSRDNFIRLLNLSISILEAYDCLHRQKVLHGDVHPDNILISPSGRVNIIDYGYAMIAGSTSTIKRGGTGFYYEPEFARAKPGENTPAVTYQAEQYSIAVLLYYLISGYHYLDFSFEPEKLYRQIASAAPLPFKYYDLAIPADLEQVLGTALSKNPQKRFASLQDFIQALAQVRNTVYETNGFYIFSKQHTEEHLVSFILQKFGWHSTFIKDGLSLPPTCSVNYGAGGIAYMYYRISCVRQDASISDLADVWANRALSYKKDYARGFYSSTLDINEKVVSRNSLYHSPAGVYVTQALISNSRNDRHTLAFAVQEFLSVAKEASDKIDLTLGKVGLLIGCALLYMELITIKDYRVSGIVSMGEKIKNEIWELLNNYPPMHDTNPVDYFGIAHGWSGLLYATLLWCDTASVSLPPNYMKRLEELSGCSIQKENIARWPLTTGNENSWPGWCNGSAGHIFLWVLLYKHFHDEKYIRLAEKLAEHLIAGMPYKNADLCCGMTGMAYAMLKLYNVTQDNRYLLAVERLKQAILKNWFNQPMKNNSLYKGEPALAIFLSEMNKPGMARMPLFE